MVDPPRRSCINEEFDIFLTPSWKVNGTSTILGSVWVHAVQTLTTACKKQLCFFNRPLLYYFVRTETKVHVHPGSCSVFHLVRERVYVQGKNLRPASAEREERSEALSRQALDIQRGRHLVASKTGDSPTSY